MKTKIYILTFIGAFLLAGSLFAAPEAQFNKLSKSYILHEDGSQEQRVTEELTINTYRAMRSMYGETFITYNPTYQKLVIHQSYTKQKDGTIIKTPNNAFVECLPSSASNAPAYNNMREMVIVHTGLELGATIYLDYSIISNPEYLSELDVCEPVQELSPIKDYTLSITVPSSKTIHYTLANGNTQPKVNSQSGTKTITWSLKDVPVRSLETGSSALSGDEQVILANTYSSLSAALNLLNKQFTAANESDVQTLAMNLAKGQKTDKAKREAIIEYVNSLELCRLTLGNAAYRIRHASEIIRTNYGTEAEKMNLLSGLLKNAGFNSDVKIAYSVKAEPNCLGLNAIENIFIDSPVLANMQDYQPIMTLDGKKATLSVNNDKVDLTDTLTIKDGMGEVLANNYKMVTLPRNEPNAWINYYTPNTTRSSNLLLPSKVNENITTIVNIPDNMQLCSESKPCNIENAVGKVLIETVKNNGEILCKRSLQINKQLITPAEYADFYKLIAEWNNPNRKSLLLKNIK